MTHITIPLPEDLVSFLDTMVENNLADSRAGLVRRILANWRDDEILAAVQEAKDEYKRGEYYEGDLRTIVAHVHKASV